MRRPDARAGSVRRATDQLLLARLLGVEEQLSASFDPQADEHLLRELLLAPETPAASYRSWLRMLLVVFAVMLALFTCLPLASAATSLLAIRKNVAAMRPPEQARIGSLELAGQAAQAMSRPSGTATSPNRSPTPGEPIVSPERSAAPDPRTAPQQPKSAPPVADRRKPDAAWLPQSRVPAGPVEIVDTISAEQRQDVAEHAGSQLSEPPTLAPRLSLAQPSATPEPAEAAITVLLLGVDRRPGQSGPARADSVIVARIDPQSGRVALVSFPRDLLVEIPGVGWDRINATTVYGDMYPELGGSLDLSRRTVESLLGIPIDHAVSVDFGGFISAVNALGGITVDVEREVYDSFTENHFAAGAQHMDGRTALWYSRIRFLDNDFERMRRQQSVLLGLLRRIREQNALQQLHSIAAVTGALRGYIQTDLPEDRMVRLAWSLRNFAPEAVEQYRLEVDQVDLFLNPADPYAQQIRPGAAEDLVRKLLGNAP